jgi:hypothetical protein
MKNGKGIEYNEPESGDLPIVCTSCLREIGRVMRYVETCHVSQHKLAVSIKLSFKKRVFYVQELIVETVIEMGEQQ